MNVQSQVKTVCEVLDKLIDENTQSFKDSGVFKVHYAPSDNTKFYLDNTEGSYESSLQGLIHHIMYHADVYSSFLDDTDMDAVSELIANDPDAIFRSDIDEYQDVMDAIYKKAMAHVRKRLASL